MRFNPRAREERDIQRNQIAFLDTVSIHALVKSATAGRSKPPGPHYVSIHALVKSATNLAVTFSPTAIGFNPRAREERDAMGTYLRKT